MAANDTTWTDAVISDLRRLWDEGHSTAEIGRRLGVTKNAVVGKVHRLALPNRPSPIRRGQQAVRRSVLQPKLVRSMPLLPTAPLPVVPALPPAPRPILAVPSRQGFAQSCCWPLGEPGRPGFRFCNAPAD